MKDTEKAYIFMYIGRCSFSMRWVVYDYRYIWIYDYRHIWIYDYRHSYLPPLTASVFSFFIKSTV